MSEPLLEFRGLSKRWPGFHLQDIRFALPGGQIMGLVGTNGAGKTTLLKTLLGLNHPDGGQIWLGGQDLTRAGGERRRRIAYVPDEPRFAPELRLRTLKEVHARFHRDWREPAWVRLMAEFGLDPAAKAGSLSLGMRTKFALTLALSRDAELLVLDEPTTGLDPQFRRELLQRLSGLIQDEHRSLLFSTHITSDLDHRVDRITLMQQGRILFSLDQDTLGERWVLVKGGLELLDADTRASFQGRLRVTGHGFEGLSDQGPAARARFAGLALVERPSLEDIVVLTGKGDHHAA